MGYCLRDEFAHEFRLITDEDQQGDFSPEILSALQVVVDIAGSVTLRIDAIDSLRVIALDEHPSGYDYNIFLVDT